MPADGSAIYIPRSVIGVAAFGARTAVGLNADSTAAAVRAGISNIAGHDRFVDRDGEPMRLSADAVLASDTPVGERMIELAISALLQLPPVGEIGGRPARILLVLCTPELRPGLPSDIADRLAHAITNRFRPANLRLQLVPQGHAAGLVGFGVAAKALDENTADMAVVLGVDSYHDYVTLDWMDERGSLKSDRNRDGFFPGEAAGLCLLVRADKAPVLGLKLLARLSAISTAVERITIGSEEVCIGEGLSAALVGLAAVVGDDEKRKITDMYCDLNGQRYRSEELMYSIMRAHSLIADDLIHLHPADCWGDVGAASGPLFAVVASAASYKNYAAGSRAVLWASSEGGRRAAVLLDFPMKTQGAD